MSFHSPFGYVGYQVQFAEIMMKLLDDLCGGCHTDDDYRKGCKECPAGQLIYECRDYLLTYYEADKHYEQYTTEEWQNRRKELYGHSDTPEQIERNRKLTESCKPESDIIRAIKVELANIEPCPSFHASWIFEENRNPDPLLKLRELIKDLKFMQSRRFDAWHFQGKLTLSYKEQMRKRFDIAKLKYDEKIKKQVAKKQE